MASRVWLEKNQPDQERDSFELIFFQHSKECPENEVYHNYIFQDLYIYNFNP